MRLELKRAILQSSVFRGTSLTQEELNTGVITIVDTRGEWAGSYEISKENY